MSSNFEIINNHINEIVGLTDEKIALIIEEWGLVAETYAAHYCPVDTGRLRASISHGKEGDDTMVVGTNVEYAPYVELGTKFQKEQPYLRPAISKHMSEYQEIAKNILSN